MLLCFGKGPAIYFSDLKLAMPWVGAGDGRCPGQGAKRCEIAGDKCLNRCGSLSCCFPSLSTGAWGATVCQTAGVPSQRWWGLAGPCFREMLVPDVAPGGTFPAAGSRAGLVLWDGHTGEQNPASQ